MRTRSTSRTVEPELKHTDFTLTYHPTLFYPFSITVRGTGLVFRSESSHWCTRSCSIHEPLSPSLTVRHTMVPLVNLKPKMVSLTS